MADLRTTISEVVTGLGMLDVDDIEHGLATRPDAIVNVGDDDWDRLAQRWGASGGAQHHDVFMAAFMNGRAFRDADDALRGRAPRLVEWKGAHKATGDEAVPADLRVDHVYFVSCKYLSRIVVNAAPSHLFERMLAGGYGRRTRVDWFAEVAPAELDALYDEVRDVVPDTLPDDARGCTAAQRRLLATTLRGAWPTVEAEQRYRALVERTSVESTARWRASLVGGGAESMLWRLLRIGSAPYYVLGASPAGFVRLRIATPWDWRQRFELRAFDVEPRPSGQPVVAWRGVVRDRVTRVERCVDGHVEIRWSHGRFCGPPEAKVYLDTPHLQVPGYFPLR
jgi:hypothetical protein